MDLKRAARRREKALQRSIAADQELRRQDHQLGELVDPLYPEVGRFNFAFSIYHECKESPVGVCLYDSVNDPARDLCLACGQPEERK